MKACASIEEARRLPRGTKGIVFAILRRCELRTASNGKNFLDVELADATGSAVAKVWSDAESAAALDELPHIAVGAALKAGFVVDEYQGAPQLNIKQARLARSDDDGYDARRLFGDVPDWLAALRCKTLVFDIETVPAAEIRSMPPTIVKALTTHAERQEMDASAVMGLSPFFGKIVTLAFGEGEKAPDEQEVTVLAVPPDGVALDTLPPWIRPMSEAQLLTAFWSLAALADVVVTFNGRGFDVPFLVARSLANGVDARVDLLSKPFTVRPHLDLYDVLAQKGRGPANLDVVCWALGIASPKENMDGSMVAPAYARGEIVTIATYNRADVRATTAVYRVLREHVLRFRKDWA